MRSPPDRFISYQNPSCPTPRFAPSEASPKSTTNAQASSMRSPPEQISRWGSSDISYSASSKRSFTQIRHKCSSSFNAKITRPAGSFSFSKPTRPYRAFTDRSSFSGPSPYLLYLHSRTFTGKIPSRERAKRNLPQTTIFTCPYAILATDRGGRVIKSPSGKEIDKEK